MPAIPSHIPALPSSAALRILRRPSPSVPGSSPASSGTSTPAGSKTSGSSQSGQSKTLRTLSEREEEYRKARERIFGPEVEGSDVAASEASDADGVVTATSSPSSITKMLGATEPASMVPRCSNSATSSVTSSTSTSSVGVSRRQNSSQVQQQTLPTNSRSASANSNGRSNRGTKRNGKGESTFEPLRPPREQQIQYQQQQLLQQHQQQQYYMQQQQYQMQLQLNGYAQSGYVGPAPAYGANMALGGMNQGPGFIPYAPSQYSQNSMQAQPATAGPAMYPNRHINPSLPMNPPNNNNVLRQPAGPDDMGSLGFGDLRIHDHHQQHRYSTGVAGAGAAPLQTEQRLTTGYNQYPPQSHNVGSHLATNPHTSAGGPGDPTASRATLTGQPSFLGATTPSPHAGYGNSNYGGARPAQQDSTLWPPLVHTSGVSSGGMTPAPGSLSLSSSEIGRKGPQHSVWRP
ncbi:hypothetical protein QFC19_003322 [Naganishia cerealis]|uniref:Uncharacterized protein n=1 Tax=Naganishia cerealis TaxID=610337 RepID=A0ACC2W4H0_9TREE|nr:hypothetical protein QFC19_003322 [Naganishia cerealis]